MKSIYLLTLVCIVNLFFTGCKKEPDLMEKMSKLRYANVTGAQSLFVTGQMTKTRGGEEAIPTLFKITVDGQTQQVNFTDNKGQLVPVKTNYVLNLSDKFVLINLGVYFPYVWKSYVFIVRKTDGAMFSPGYTGQNDVSQTIFSYYNYSYNEGEEGENIYDFIEGLPEMAVDKDNNVYFNSHLDKTLYKIHDDASGNMFATGLNSPTTLPSNGAYVNKNGDVWFTDSKLCRLTSGELIRTPDVSYSYFHPFLLPSQNHNFYRLDPSERVFDPDGLAEAQYEWKLYKYCAQKPEMKEELVSSGKSDDGGVGSFVSTVQLSDCLAIIYGNAICVIRNESDIRFYNVKFPSNKPAYLVYKSAGQYIYYYDEIGNIGRFDTSVGTLETVYSNAGYQVKSIRSCSVDTVLFTAIDLKTGNNVLVEVKNGVANVIDTIDGHKVIQFERIN